MSISNYRKILHDLELEIPPNGDLRILEAQLETRWENNEEVCEKLCMVTSILAYPHSYGYDWQPPQEVNQIEEEEPLIQPREEEVNVTHGNNTRGRRHKPKITDLERNRNLESQAYEREKRAWNARRVKKEPMDRPFSHDISILVQKISNRYLF